MSEENGGKAAPGTPAFRRTDRTDAPYYLARYAERKSRQASLPAVTDPGADADLPLYLRRFRERGAKTAASTLLEVDGSRPLSVPPLRAIMDP